MTQQDYKHPITPPPELVQQWADMIATHTDTEIFGAAAQWGADQELKACCKWLPKLPPWSGDDLRRHRRPKPPSLKEQALAQLDHLLERAEKVTEIEAALQAQLDEQHHPSKASGMPWQ
jgi:hypothetical protein